MDTPGKRIIKWREHLKQKPREFAAATGIPYTTLKTIESDSNKPSYDVLVKLRNACPQLNIDWIFDEGGSEPMLRDGRTLTPATAPATSETETPEPPTTPSGALSASPGGVPIPGEATPAQADYIGRLIRVLEDELEASKQRAGYWQDRAERLEKPSPAPSATRPLPPATQISLRPTACTPPEAAKAGKVVAMWPAAEQVLAAA